MNSKERLLFFDVARITAISGILLLHYCHFYNMPYNNGTPGTIWILNTGKAGNILFIIISGAMLEYTHSAIKNKKDLLAFYYNRFIRIVPAYWMSLIIGVLLFPNLITYSVSGIFEQLTASTVYINSYSPALNPPAYFIVIIVVLALLFPFIRKPVNTYPGITLFILLIISIISWTFVEILPNLQTPPTMVSTAPFAMNLAFPAYAFFFALGIWIMQTGRYPLTENKNILIIFLSELSFYLYLTHYMFLEVPGINANILLLLLITFFTSCILMVLDKKIHTFLKNIAPR